MSGRLISNGSRDLQVTVSASLGEKVKKLRDIRTTLSPHRRYQDVFAPLKCSNPTESHKVVGDSGWAVRAKQHDKSGESTERICVEFGFHSRKCGPSTKNPIKSSIESYRLTSERFSSWETIAAIVSKIWHRVPSRALIADGCQKVSNKASHLVSLKIILNVSHSAEAFCVFPQSQSSFTSKEENESDWSSFLAYDRFATNQNGERSKVYHQLSQAKLLLFLHQLAFQEVSPRGLVIIKAACFCLASTAAGKQSCLLWTLAFGCKPFAHTVWLGIKQPFWNAWPWETSPMSHKLPSGRSWLPFIGTSIRGIEDRKLSGTDARKCSLLI